MVERYNKITKIGSGTFGEAWLVNSICSGRSYVIKEVRAHDLTDDELSMTQREATVLARCKHINIIRYKESFIMRDPIMMCLVMEYADGGDLFQKEKEAMEMKRRIPESSILNWFIQMIFAVQYLHSNDILHRDLKTQNIFLTKNDIVKVGDFGIARFLRSKQELATTAIGTPYYLSPEICLRKPYNHKSDMWALGCILYELCTLKHPFEAGDFENLIFKILKGQYPPLNNFYSKLVQDLTSVLLRTRPEKRPSADQLLLIPQLRTLVQQYIKKHESHLARHESTASKDPPEGRKSVSTPIPRDTKSSIKTPDLKSVKTPDYRNAAETRDSKITLDRKKAAKSSDSKITPNRKKAAETPDSRMTPDRKKSAKTPDSRITPDRKKSAKTPDSRITPDRNKSAETPDSRITPDRKKYAETPDSRITPDRKKSAKTPDSRITPDRKKSAKTPDSRITPDSKKCAETPDSRITPDRKKCAETPDSRITPNRKKCAETPDSRITPNRKKCAETPDSRITPDRKKCAETPDSRIIPDRKKSAETPDSRITPDRKKSAVTSDSRITPKKSTRITDHKYLSVRSHDSESPISKTQFKTRKPNRSTDMKKENSNLSNDENRRNVKCSCSERGTLERETSAPQVSRMRSWSNEFESSLSSINSSNSSDVGDFSDMGSSEVFETNSLGHGKEKKDSLNSNLNNASREITPENDIAVKYESYMKHLFQHPELCAVADSYSMQQPELRAIPASPIQFPFVRSPTANSNQAQSPKASLRLIKAALKPNSVYKAIGSNLSPRQTESSRRKNFKPKLSCNEDSEESFSSDVENEDCCKLRSSQISPVVGRSYSQMTNRSKRQIRSIPSDTSEGSLEEENFCDFGKTFLVRPICRQ